MQSAQPRHEDHSKIHSEEWHDAAEEDAVSEPDEFHDAEDDHQASVTAPSSAQAPSEQGSASSAKLDKAVHATRGSQAALRLCFQQSQTQARQQQPAQHRSRSLRVWTKLRLLLLSSLSSRKR